jgi:hypothetical protein
MSDKVCLRHSKAQCPDCRLIAGKSKIHLPGDASIGNYELQLFNFAASLVELSSSKVSSSFSARRNQDHCEHRKHHVPDSPESVCCPERRNLNERVPRVRHGGTTRESQLVAFIPSSASSPNQDCGGHSGIK